jgi:hypothetical protein
LRESTSSCLGLAGEAITRLGREWEAYVTWREVNVIQHEVDDEEVAGIRKQLGSGRDKTPGSGSSMLGEDQRIAAIQGNSMILARLRTQIQRGWMLAWPKNEALGGKLY